MAGNLFNGVINGVKEARESIKDYLDSMPDAIVEYLANEGGIVLYNAVYNNSHCVFRTDWLEYIAMFDHECYADAVELAKYFNDLRNRHEPCFCSYKSYINIESLGSQLDFWRKVVSDRLDAIRKEHGYLFNIGTEACRTAYWQIMRRDAELNKAKAKINELYKDFFSPVYRVLIGEAMQERLRAMK